MELLIRMGILFKKETVFTIDYKEGYNINYEITQKEAASILPPNLKPLKLKLLESDREEKYYLSWYLAGIEQKETSNRIDLFTYAIDEHGDLALYFLSSIMETPKAAIDNPLGFKMLKIAMEYFARDSKSNRPAYPHYYTDHLKADKDSFSVRLEGASLSSHACRKNFVALFSRDFVLANSQIYRNGYDRNVNYFNQSFISAKVEDRDPSCIESENLAHFHPLLKPENLVSMHFYGSKDKKITWFFEM